MSKALLVNIVPVSLALLGCGGATIPVPTTGGESGPPVAELVAKGRAAATRGDAVRAEQYLGLALKHGADTGAVLPILLRACLNRSHLRAALNYAQPYLLEHPENDSLRYLVANIHQGLGQTLEARRELGLLLARNGTDPDAHYLLGIIESDVNFAEARRHFVQTMEHTRNDDQRVEVQSRLASLNVREQEVAAARAMVQP